VGIWSRSFFVSRSEWFLDSHRLGDANNDREHGVRAYDSPDTLMSCLLSEQR